MINICTLMRDSEPYIERFFRQLDFLDPNEHKIFIGEGDSVDDTLKYLSEYKNILPNINIYNVLHGGPNHGSVINQQRFLQLAYSGNIVWNISNSSPSDITARIDADLVYEPKTLKDLITNLSYKDVHVVAPKVLLNRQGFPSNTFYDTFCFRQQNGKRLAASYPYYIDYSTCSLNPMSSVGGFVAMFSYIANKVYFPAKDVFIGMCDQITNLGYNIYMNSSLEVYHE